VLFLTDGEPTFSRRCADRAQADYVAAKFGQDQTLKGGYTAG
jgi:hypothetical protein